MQISRLSVASRLFCLTSGGGKTSRSVDFTDWPSAEAKYLIHLPFQGCQKCLRNSCIASIRLSPISLRSRSESLISWRRFEKRSTQITEISNALLVGSLSHRWRICSMAQAVNRGRRSERTPPTTNSATLHASASANAFSYWESSVPSPRKL